MLLDQKSIPNSQIMLAFYRHKVKTDGEAVTSNGNKTQE